MDAGGVGGVGGVMTVFYAYVRQGEGCDYTIACGETLWPLDAKSKEAAIEKLKACILTYRRGNEIEAADLLEIANYESMPVDQWYTEQETAEELEAKAKREAQERQEYERLKEKFGVA